MAKKVSDQERKGIANRKVGEIEFDCIGMIPVQENGACPFCGQTLSSFPEYGVGGYMENLQSECSCGFHQSPYDGWLVLPDSWVAQHPEAFETTSSSGR